MLSNFKSKEKHTGDKFLALMLSNSLMRTHNGIFLSWIEKKLLQRLYIVAAKEKSQGPRAPKPILDYSNTNFKDVEASKKFHILLEYQFLNYTL